MIARVLVVLAAFAGLAVLAGELGTARDVERAEAITRAQGSIPDALALLREAAAGTADTTPLLRQAQLQLFAGRPRAAVGSARAAVRREPENAQGWLLLAQAAERAGDARLGAQARRRVAALVAQP